MRIALIAPPWIAVPPAAYGGTEAVLDTLARGLADAGHEVVLATTGDSTCPVRRIWLFEEAQFHAIGDAPTELRHLADAYGRVDGVDLVHDHTVAGPLVAQRLHDGPLVTTNHGPFTEAARDIYRKAGDRAQVVAISHHQAGTAGDIPIARVIHHGLDERHYPVGAGRGGYLAFLGRMSPTKGVEEAIRVARLAGLPLKIAAKLREPGERSYFTSCVEPLLGGDIEYVGEVDLAGKLELLGAATALLNPIRWDEPFGLCMIEALACGTPVVTTPRGAAPEIVDDGITGFTRRGRAGLVRAVTEAASLSRERCREAVVERFSMRRMAADHIALYRDVLAGKLERAPEPLQVPA